MMDKMAERYPPNLVRINFLVLHLQHVIVKSALSPGYQPAG
jgi:hypothetical protein